MYPVRGLVSETSKCTVKDGLKGISTLSLALNVIVG